MRRLQTVLLFLVPGLLAAQARPVRPINWDSLTAETTRNLSSYLKVNTSNPPGNEILAARFLKGILEREGIESQILDTVELGLNRANFYARLRGNGSKKAIALVHHMDVVPATPSSWTNDPFSGVVKDGYIWGRGAIDMKGNGMAQVMALIALKRSGVPLNRDIVIIGNADEELTSTGGLTFVSRHADLLRDVEYLITEGADSYIENGKVVYFAVGVAEKRTFWQRLTVNGVPSHGSRPTKLNPVPKLVAALYKISQYETPLHVTPGVQKFFRDISRDYPEPKRAWLADVSTALKNPEARDWILSDVSWNAFLRNTISLTGLAGSNKTNVIPGVATADIDVRILPDQDPAEFLATLQRIVGDTAVHFSTLLQPKTPLESPIETDLFHAIERAAHDRAPSAFVTTPMETAATDRPTYRKLGITTYGFSPFLVPRPEIQRGMHGNDERLSLDNVAYGVRFYYDILRYAQ
ncbi:MAG TPA: M20/M25/M40 family metallo-hydrolase [Gemmatimonadaceae bacterium]|jgi:acetylornithine deacetylase/succinyl-diaminopimelate desuccinylase-like protein